MRKPSMIEQFRYRFDNYMSKGTVALIGGLGIISLVIIVIATIILILTGIAPEGEGNLGFLEALWQSLMRAMDPGSVAGDIGWPYRIIMFLVTIGGIFILSALIGVLTSGLETKIEELQKGKSKVIENGHTVILGWSPQIFTIISELIIANENQKRGCIVIMGEADKVEMEEEVRERIDDFKTTKVVCRSGSPLDISDLKIVNLDNAKSIIVLSPEKKNPDADVIKTILAITNNPNRQKGKYNIVAEIHDPKNMEVAEMVGKDEVELVLVGDLVSRIMAQTCRQSGLSIVYTELMDFDGDEMYFADATDLVGKTYGESLFSFKQSAVMGIMRTDHTPEINPPMDRVIEKGEQMIVITEDDDTATVNKSPVYSVQDDLILSTVAEEVKKEKALILGWNWRAPAIIKELDAYVAKGSEVKIVADYKKVEEELDKFCPSPENLSIDFLKADTTDRRVLDGLNITQFDHILILCYTNIADFQEADSKTLIALLHLRDILEKQNEDISIVSEMLDLRNRALAEVTKADDFIVSDKMISLILSQISENKFLNKIFADLFDPEGSEVYIRDASNYVKTGVEMDFYTVLEAAKRKGETAIGYRKMVYMRDASEAYGVIVNPDKSEKFTLDENDKIIVLAED